MIRLAGPADGKAIAAIYAPIVSETPISFEYVPPGEVEMAGRVTAALRHAPWLVCADGRDVMGYAYASKHRDRAAYQWMVDVSVYIGEDHRRRGVGRALYASLFALLRLQGFYSAYAGITMANAQSILMHEALGFRRIGIYPAVGFKFGAWHDVGWWRLALREVVSDPEPPLSMAEAQARPGWNDALAEGQSLLRG